jgi:hypothetical protein
VTLVIAWSEIDVLLSRDSHFLLCRLAAAGLLLLCGSSTAAAQLRGVEGRYHPLNQMSRPGQTGEWAARLDPSRVQFHQPVRIELPSEGEVAVYSGPLRQLVPLTAPAVAGVAVGHVYRLKIGEMPEYPGIDLYPSIEIVDRLHPPAGQLFEFPVPIPITAEEIDLALQGSLVTKVIFLEQPQLAVPRLQDGLVGEDVVPPYRNAFAEADRRGRPMVILRIGGRVPSSQGEDAAFFGSGAKITLPPGPGGGLPAASRSPLRTDATSLSRQTTR